MERFPSGQRGQTVNLLAKPSKVRILLSPLSHIREQMLLVYDFFCLSVPEIADGSQLVAKR